MNSFISGAVKILFGQKCLSPQEKIGPYAYAGRWTKNAYMQQ